MKNLALFHLVFVLAVVTSSCAKEAPSDSEVKVFETRASSASELRFSELFTKLEYVALETNKDCFITQIDKIHFDGTYIYVFQDSERSKALFIFDKNGKHQITISDPGEGPGKFLGARDFLCSKDTIEILDRYQQKILKYNKSGRFLQEVFLGQPFDQFVKLSDASYIFFSCYQPLISEDETLQYFNIHYASPSGQVNASYLPIHNALQNVLLAKYNFSSGYDNSYLLTTQFSDTIFRLTAENVFPNYIVKLSDVWIDNVYLDKFENSDINGKLTLLNENDKVNGFAKVEETAKYIFIMYSFNKHDYWVFIDKVSGSVRSYYEKKRASKPNDIDGGLMPSRLKAAYQDKFIFYLQAEDIVHYMSNNSNLASDSFLNFAKSINSYSNPVIVFATLK